MFNPRRPFLSTVICIGITTSLPQALHTQLWKRFPTLTIRFNLQRLEMGSCVCLCLGVGALKPAEGQSAQSLPLLQEDCRSPLSSSDTGSETTYTVEYQQLHQSF